MSRKQIPICVAIQLSGWNEQFPATNRTLNHVQTQLGNFLDSLQTCQCSIFLTELLIFDKRFLSGFIAILSGQMPKNKTTDLKNLPCNCLCRKTLSGVTFLQRRIRFRNANKDHLSRCYSPPCSSIVVSRKFDQFRLLMYWSKRIKIPKPEKLTIQRFYNCFHSSCVKFSLEPFIQISRTKIYSFWLSERCNILNV